MTVVGLLESVDLLLSSGFQPKRTIYLAFGQDEEIGGLQGAEKTSARESHNYIRLSYQRDISMKIRVTGIFQRSKKYEGVRPIHIYLLRLLYILIFFVLGKETWVHILAHHGPWDPDRCRGVVRVDGVRDFGGIGIIHPLKMLPIVLLEIFYKVLWLILVAYPLWSKGVVGFASGRHRFGVLVGAIAHRAGAVELCV
jgi:hypothetical protein